MVRLQDSHKNTTSDALRTCSTYLGAMFASALLLVLPFLPANSDSIFPAAPPLSGGSEAKEIEAASPLMASQSIVGESDINPLPDSRAAELGSIDSIHIIRHGALEGTKVVTPGDSLAYLGAEWVRDHLLHNRTREATVERRLLFRKGDPIDSLRLAETERTLRAERFIAEASVRTRRTKEGRNIVDVETWDQWSTSVPFSIGRAGGEITWGAGFNESNLLGTGQEIGFSYQSKPLQKAWNFGYANRSFLLPRHVLSLYWSNTSDGGSLALRLGHPLESRYQDWAWMLEADDAEADRIVYGDVSLWQELRRTHPAVRSVDWGGGTSGDGVGSLDAASIDELSSFGPLAWYGGTHTQKVRLWVQRVWGTDLRVSTGPLVESQKDSSGSLYVSGRLPASLRQEMGDGGRWQGLLDGPPEVDDRRIGWMGSLRRDRWIRKKNFNNLKWMEDIPVGWLLEASTAQTVVSRGESKDGQWNQLGGRWSGLVDRTYAVASASWIGRSGGSGPFQDRQALSWKTELRQLTNAQFQGILTASGDFVADAPVTSQLTLGEETGLPGFPAHSLVGTTRNLFGSELRWTPPIEAFTLVPALAAFAGAGRVGDEIRPLGSGQWHYGAGVGLRFGLTRSINGVVNHLSISRPLGPEGGDWNEGGSWMLSFGTRQSL